MCARFRQILVFVLMGAMLALAVPASAFADESSYRVVWGPNVVPGPSGGGGGGHPIEGDSGSGGGAGTTFDGDASGSLYGVMVYAPNRYAAAMLVCGVAWNDSRIDHDKRMALSNETAGGDFYTFAQRFSSISDGSGSFTVPDFYGNAYKNENMLWGVCSTYSKMYKSVNIYQALYNNTQLQSANRKLNDILNGTDDGGGGGSGGGSGQDDEYIYPTNYIPTGVITLNAVDKSATQESMDYRVSQTLSDRAATNDYKYYFVYKNNQYTPTSGNIIIACVRTQDIVIRKSNAEFVNLSNNAEQIKVYGQASIRMVDGAYESSGSIYPSSGTYDIPANGFTRIAVVYAWYGDGGSGGSGGGSGDTPDGDWPDDDPVVSPSPPDLPTPRDPTIPIQPQDPIVTDTPAPQLPDPTDPTIPVVGNPVDDDNFTADLQGVIDAMNEHCIHLQQRMGIVGDYITSSFQVTVNDLISAMNTAFATYTGNLVTNMHTEHDADRTTISNQVAWLVDDVNENFDVLMEYLEDLWGFLDEKLDFSFTSYDDDSLMGWLEKIYMKLGSGIDTRPVDPVSEPDNSGDWLSQFLASFFGALLGSLASVLTDATATMTTLATKFPFSIPWDIMAILGMLVAQPVCPDVVIPCYSLTANGLAQVGSYEINLEDIEFAVEGIRWMLRIGFILLLLSRTKDFIELIEGVIG